MRIKLAATFSFLTSVCLILTSCSDGPSAGDPTPEKTQPATTSTAQNAAPKVDSPIDTTLAQEQPCSIVSLQQIGSLGSTPREAKSNTSDPLGPLCDWIFASGQGRITGQFVTANKDGLGSLYAKQSAGSLTKFEPVESVAGYPAVIYSNSTVNRSGLCTLAVGVRNNITYTVVAQLGTEDPNRDDPCSVAVKVAEFAVENMQGG